MKPLHDSSVALKDELTSPVQAAASTVLPETPGRARCTNRTVFFVVGFLLLTSGWATNHFSTMVAVLREQEHFAPMVVNGAFGIYALGLVPSLLGGGLVADRVGPRPVVLTGALAAAAGNGLLLWWQTAAGLLIGRFVIGLGVGLAMSAGTAWAGKLRGSSGVILAGILLTTGFAVGPIVSGILAHALSEQAAVAAPFIVAMCLSCVAVIASVLINNKQPHNATTDSLSPPMNPSAQQSMARALATSIPMALWVFSTASIALVTLTERVSTNLDAGVLLPGIAALLAFSAGLAAQALARRFNWGPKTGVIAAVFAAAGFIITGLGSSAPPLWLFVIAAVLLGTAYGMALREGLVDVERYAPGARRGTTLGIYYVFTYLGFGLPVLLQWLLPVTGYVWPLLILGALALGCALVRAAQCRHGVLAR